MKITEVQVSMQRTVNLGNYESARFQAGCTASVEPDEDPNLVTKGLHHWCVNRVTDAIRDYFARKGGANGQSNG